MQQERPWHPDSWAEFVTAFEDGRARVVVFSRAREWAKGQGWSLRAGFFGSFKEAIVQRIVKDEASFWGAYRVGAVDFWIVEEKGVASPADPSAPMRRVAGRR